MMTESIPYFVLAFVQAATEFLPVSSSGHLLFIKGLMHLEEIPILFDIVVHVGSLMAIVIYYRKGLKGTISALMKSRTAGDSDRSHRRFILFILVATIVTLFFYILFREHIEKHYRSPGNLVYTFGFTTCLLLATRIFRHAEPSGSPGRLFLAVLVGLFQGLAIMPGISRSGSTIAPLLLYGVDREQAAFTSFTLAIPAILGALFFKVLQVENTAYLSSHGLLLGVSLVVSAGLSLLFLAFLVRIIKRGGFWLFSFYTAAMGVLSFILFR